MGGVHEGKPKDSQGVGTWRAGECDGSLSRPDPTVGVSDRHLSLANRKSHNGRGGEGQEERLVRLVDGVGYDGAVTVRLVTPGAKTSGPLTAAVP